MRTDLMSPERIALEYDGNKQKIAAAAQSGILNPTVAVMAGMFIDRMRATAMQEQTSPTTVAQDVMASAGLGATPQAQQLAQGQEQAMAAMPPMDRGVASLPVDERMVPGGEGYAGGGIVAFAGEDGSFVKSDTGYYSPNPRLSRYVESKETGGYRGDPNKAVSPKGARGRMQIMPETAMKPGYGVKNIFDMADDMGIKYKDRTKASAEKLLENSKLNKTFGDSYLGAMERRFKGDPKLAAAAYNAGPGAVTRAGGVPNIKETQEYVAGLPAIAPVAAAPVEAPVTLAAAPAPAAVPQERSLLSRLSPISSAQAGELYPTTAAPTPDVPTKETAQLAQDRAFLGDIATRAGSAAADVATAVPRGLMGAINTGIIRPARAITGQELPYIPDFLAPEGSDYSSATPFYDKYVRATSGEMPEEEQRRLAGLPSGAVISEGAPKTIDELREAAKRTAEEPRDVAVRPDMSEYMSGQRPITPASPEMAAIAAAQRAAEKPTEAPAGAKEADYLAELRQSLSDRAAASAKQREEDKYMALLTAGLGIMSGTSPYAMANIGAGGIKGAQYFADARKQRREEEQDILSGRLGLAKLGAEEAYRSAVLKERAAGRGIQEKMYQTKVGELRRKALSDWDAGPGPALEKSFNKKDWRNDATLKLQYDAAKARYINDIVSGGMAELETPSATDLLR